MREDVTVSETDLEFIINSNTMPSQPYAPGATTQNCASQEDLCQKSYDSQFLIKDGASTHKGPPLLQNFTYTITKAPKVMKMPKSVNAQGSIMVTGVFVDGSIMHQTSVVRSLTGTFAGYTALAEAFTDCSGDLSFGPRDAMYHFHSLPYCLVHSLGGTVPDIAEWSFMEPNVEYEDRETWTLSAQTFLTWVKKWPAKGRAVLLGYAADGHPMYSPYDEFGNLIAWGNTSLGNCEEPDGFAMDKVYDFNTCVMARANVTVQTPLDQCNGMWTSSGEYRYYLTPTPPFQPVCLVGDFKVPHVHGPPVNYNVTVLDQVFDKCGLPTISALV